MKLELGVVGIELEVVEMKLGLVVVETLAL